MVGHYISIVNYQLLYQTRSGYFLASLFEAGKNFKKLKK